MSASLLLALIAAPPAAPRPAQPTAPPQLRVPLDAGANVVIDANSYYARWTYAGIDEIGELGTLFASSGASHRNFAIPGQTWENMRASISDTVGGFDPAKKNILVCGETRNMIFTHPGWLADGVDAAAEKLLSAAARYIQAAQREVKTRYGRGWDAVIICGTIPNSADPVEKYSEAQTLTANAAMLKFDEVLRADPSRVGADAFADFRTHAPQFFGGDGSSRAGFAQDPALVMEKGAAWIHPLGAAREALAGAIAVAIRKVSGAEL